MKSETPIPNQPQTPDSHNRPVAYDAEGRPLYAHPPAPQVVQTIRPLEPPKQEMSVRVRERHEASRRRFPTLNLSEGEYIIRAVRRHPIGLVLPMGLGVILLALSLTALISYNDIVMALDLNGVLADSSAMMVPLILFSLLIVVGIFVVYYVYINNKFFLTNESVIQEIQTSLFSRHEQTVSLNNIEDASYQQTNIIQHLFDYGSIRLSTEGDETTYRFTYVAHPKEHVATLNNAVEAFKLGRPVDVSED